jgi:hypothetical protein
MRLASRLLYTLARRGGSWKTVNAPRPLLASLSVTLMLFLMLFCITTPLRASTSYHSSLRQPDPVAMGALNGSLFSAMRPRCELELTGPNFAEGDRVSASWRIRNPSPTRVA